MPEERVLNEYNLVFKREPFKDRGRYNISEENKKKICATMLGSPLSPVARSKIFQPILEKVLVPKVKEKHKKEYDVFFSGTVAKHNDYRADIWREVKKNNFKTKGGLQYRNRGNKPEDDLLGSEISKKEYIKTIYNSKICLALNGVGEFTFRHLELWQLGAFMLCPKVINQLDLPIKPIDGKHFVSFSDADDLIKKIRYYLEHKEERKKIAQEGQLIFNEQYSSKKHGEYIKEVLKEKLGI